MVDFDHHEQNWSNRMILGDSLLGMTTIAEKESPMGYVKMTVVNPQHQVGVVSRQANSEVSTPELAIVS